MCISVNAQSHDPRWERWEAEMIIDETFVQGFGVLKYLLFRVDESGHETNFMLEGSFHIAFINSLEEIGYIVDYGSIRAVADNRNLSVNVIRLMNRHSANVSVTIIDYGVIINMALTLNGRRVYDTISFNIFQKSN